MKKIILLFALFSFTTVQLRAAEVKDSLWNGAVNAYNEADYDTALKNFKQIEELGYKSPELYYNIGNSYYKMSGYIAYSILYYEKALRMNPSYKDAANNLALAQQFTLDRIEEVPEFVLVTWARDFRNIFSSDMWAYTAIALFAVFALLMVFFRYGRTLTGRKVSFIFAILFFVLFAISVTCSISLRSEMLRRDEAIIVSPVSSVKSSPNDSGKSLLIIHEGTKVGIIDELGTWRRIELGDGRQGWVMERDIEII